MTMAVLYYSTSTHEVEHTISDVKIRQLLCALGLVGFFSGEQATQPIDLPLALQCMQNVTFFDEVSSLHEQKFRHACVHWSQVCTLRGHLIC